MRKIATKRRVLLLLVGLVLASAYIHGTFDRTLSGVGLNFHPCARNGFGATFCGDELTEYRERIAQGKREGEEAARRVENAAGR